MRGKRLVGAVAAAALVLAVAVPAVASFARSSSVSQQVDTAVLQPPTLVVASNTACIRNKSVAVVVTWTPTTSAFATGYEVLRDGVVIGTVAGQLVNSFVDTTTAFDTTYSYAVRAMRNYWRSAPSEPASIKTLSKVCR